MSTKIPVLPSGRARSMVMADRSEAVSLGLMRAGLYFLMGHAAFIGLVLVLARAG
jgi:hypothetical protein